MALLVCLEYLNAEDGKWIFLYVVSEGIQSDLKSVR